MVRSIRQTWNIGDLGVGLTAWFNIIAILLYKTGIAGIEGLRKATESRKDPVLIQKILGCHPYLDEVVAMQNVINRQLLWVTV
jgi:hypothetical protein